MVSLPIHLSSTRDYNFLLNYHVERPFVRVGNTNTTGNFDFAVCTIVCRVQIHGHTANMIFAKCAQENTRQNQSTRQSHGLPCAFFSTRQRNTLPCVFLWHTAKSWFAVCFFLAHGKAIKIFLSSHFETFSTLHIQHVALHVKIWYIFVFICYI